jgi:hypothetical protein
MIESKKLLDSLVGETNIKHKTVDIKQQTVIANMVSNPPRSGKGLTAEVNLFEGPFGPEGKPSNTPLFSTEKVIGIGSDRKALATSEISYAALTLHRPNPKRPNSPGKKVNLDFIVNDSTIFNKLVFALTQKDSDFYANLPDHWTDIEAYAQAFEFYRQAKKLKIEAWIGKGCVRQTWKPGKRVKSKMRAATAMVIYNDRGTVSGRCWIEGAQFDFEFDQLLEDNRLYVAKSEPFQPQVVWDESPWL